MSRRALTNLPVFEADEVLIPKSAFTISLWVKFLQNSGEDVFSFGDFCQVIIINDVSLSTISVAVNFAQTQVISVQFPKNNNWNHYGITFQNNIVSITVNGSQLSSRNVGNNTGGTPDNLIIQQPVPQATNDALVGPIATWNTSLIGYYLTQLAMGARPTNILPQNLIGYFLFNSDPENDVISGFPATINQFPLVQDDPPQGVFAISIGDILNLSESPTEQGGLHNNTITDLIVFNYTLRGIKPAANDYLTTINADGPYFYLRFEEASGAFLDSSGHGRTGTGSGSETRQDINIVTTGGYSLGLPGPTAFAENLNCPGSGDFSLEIWANFASSGVLFYDNSNARSMCYVDFGGTLHFNIDGVDHSSGITISGAVNYHIVLIGATIASVPKLRFYVNGVKIYDATASSIPGFSDIIAGTDGAGNDLSGNIDEFAYYTFPLSDAQVLNHYDIGSGLSPMGNNFDISLNDSIIFSDSTALKSPKYTSAFSNIVYNDTVGGPGFYRFTQIDQLFFTEFINERSPFYLQLIDELFFTQSLREGGTERQPVNDSIIFTDSVKLHNFKLTVLDIFVITDKLKSTDLHQVVLDGILIDDSVHHNLKFASIVDTMAIFDPFGVAGPIYPDSANGWNLHQKTFSEIVYFDSIVVKQLNQRLIDVLDFEDNVGIWLSHVYDTLVFTDFVLHIIPLSVTDTIVFTTTQVRVKPASLSDSITFTDSMTYQASHLVNDTVVFKSITCLLFDSKQVPSDNLVMTDFVTGLILNPDNINNNNPGDIGSHNPTFTADYDLDLYDTLNLKDKFLNSGDGITEDDSCLIG